MVIVSERGWLASYQPLKLEARLQITKHSRCLWGIIRMYSISIVYRLKACASQAHPFTGCEHRQREGLWGPVQRRRECGTLYVIARAML
jgi:hypothetical protein